MTLAANGLPSPSTAWKEIPLAGEPALFKDFARDIVAYQKKDADKNGLLRGFHAKIHAGLMAEFQVLADLPSRPVTACSPSRGPSRRWSASPMAIPTLIQTPITNLAVLPSS
jgi:hypothetical protein